MAVRRTRSTKPIKPSRYWKGSAMAFFPQATIGLGFDASSSVAWAVKWLHARHHRFQSLVSDEGRWMGHQGNYHAVD
jgi:hypothetical protein